MTTLTITADSLGVAQLGDRIASIDPASFGQQVLKSVNDTMVRTDAEATNRMLSGVNLAPAKLNDRKHLYPATDAERPVARIRVEFSRATLASFGATETPVAVNWSNQRITQMGRTLKPRPANGNPMKMGIWTERTGVQSVGVLPNFKRQGIEVQVTKGAPKSLAHGFLIRKNNTLVAMKRRRSGKVEAAKALAPYQLFKHALSPDFLKLVADDLEKSIGDGFDNTLRKAGL